MVKRTDTEHKNETTKTVVLDCKKLQHPKEAHEYLAEKLAFPEYYGKNLDALFDCLTDLWDRRIILKNPEILDADSYGKKILRVLKDAAGKNPGLTVKSETEKEDLH